MGSALQEIESARHSGLQHYSMRDKAEDCQKKLGSVAIVEFAEHVIQNLLKRIACQTNCKSRARLSIEKSGNAGT